jgi:RNA recognition motif-containing protein
MDLFNYFSQFGAVADVIVMRDKVTGRGRGFGFVKMVYKDEGEAQKKKEEIVSLNHTRGHYILDKKVDVKSADEYQGK